MVSVDNVNRDLQKICIAHCDGLKDIVYGRLNKRLKNYSVKLNPLKEFIQKNYIEILSGKPDKLKDIHDKYIVIINRLNLNKKLKTQCLKDIKYIFNYKDFITEDKKNTNKYWAYTLAKNLDVTVCPYCNANYILTVYSSKGLKVTRPELDHFYPKSSHPILSISFYNLIPSCKVCNSGSKKSNILNIDDHFHPYLHRIIDDLLFSYIPLNSNIFNGINENFKIDINYKQQDHRVRNHIKAFNLNEIYQFHKSTVAEILMKSHAQGGSYYSYLKNAFPGLKLSTSDFYRLAYGNYINDLDLEKRPLSKLVRDIVFKLDNYFLKFDGDISDIS